MKVIIYARYSPRRDEDEGRCESNKIQIAYCRDWAARHGHEIVGKPFTDDAMSGDIEQRPGLWAAIAQLKKGYGLIVYRLDRLARELYLSLTIEHEVKRKGAVIFSVSGEGTWEDTEENQLLRNIISAVAAYERAVIAARTSAAMMRHQHNGRRMSGRLPYGWMADLANPKRMVPNWPERAMVRRILELRAKGNGIRKSARILEDEGIRSRIGKQFDPTTIMQIIRHWQGAQEELKEG